jgi:hypothetical protein
MFFLSTPFYCLLARLAWPCLYQAIHTAHLILTDYGQVTAEGSGYQICTGDF